MPDPIKSFLGLFADDTKMYRPISSSIDIHLLQQDLNTLLEWCGTWLSFSNFVKCKHMIIVPKPASKFSKHYFYFNNEVHLICIFQEEKDLGVTPDENLHFKTQSQQCAGHN